MRLPSVLTEQWSEAERFWRNRQIRTALLVPWAESFTAAFITPVYPYFMQGLGLQAGQMGVFRATQLALNALSAPLAGWLLDTRGPWLGIALPSSACAFACALRAFATGFSTLEVAAVFSGLSGAKVDMAIAHTYKHTPEKRRTLAVSAANVQQKVLLLLGTLCFTPLDALLKVLLPASSFGMLRFRIEISLCMFGCGFGVIVLLLAKDALAYGAGTTTSSTSIPSAPAGKAPDVVAAAAQEEEGTAVERGACCSSVSDHGAGSDGGSAQPTPPRSPPPLGASSSSPGAAATTTASSATSLASTLDVLLSLPRVLLLCQVALFFASLVRDMTYITWPLFLKEHYGWAEREYGLLLPLTQILQAAILISAPWLHERLGTPSAILLLGVIGTLGYLFAFSLQVDSSPLVVLHLLSYLAGDMCNRGAEIVLTAFASTYAPPHALGRLFAMMAIMRYAGSISGNLAGTALYQYSIAWSDGPAFLAGGALPTTLVSLPALLNVLALAHCTRDEVALGRRGYAGGGGGGRYAPAEQVAAPGGPGDGMAHGGGVALTGLALASAKKTDPLDDVIEHDADMTTPSARIYGGRFAA